MIDHAESRTMLEPRAGKQGKQVTRAVLIFASSIIILVGAMVLASALRVQADSVLTTIPVGTTPQQIHLTPDGSELFVSNEVSNTVSVISTSSDTVIGTIPVGTDPGPIRFTPNGAKAYVVNQLSNNVSAIDVATRTVTATIPVGTSPVTLSVTLDGSKVYVVNKGSNNVYVISTATDTVIGSPITVGTAPDTIDKTPDGTKLYVANSTSDNVSVIATANDTVVTTISVLPSKDPGSIHFLPDGSKAYVANRGCVTICSPDVPPTVSVINVATNSVVTTINNVGLGGAAPHAMRITPDGSKLYLINKHGDDIVVINTATDTVATTIPLASGSCTNIAFGAGSCPVRIEMTPDGSRAYVVEERPLAANGVLTEICTGIVPAVCGGASTDTVMATLMLGNSPVDLEIMGGLKAYIGNSGSNSVSVIALTVDSSVGGTYGLLLTFSPGDAVHGIPGSYQRCLTDLQQSGKNLTTKILCYFDSPSITVNPHRAAGSATMGVSSCPPANPKYCGDGQEGAPPPGCALGSSCVPPSPNCPLLPCDVSQYQFADIETKHTQLLGFLDNMSNTMNLSGCFQDFDGFGQWGNVYVQAQINGNTETGSANVYRFQSAANCMAGTPSGSAISASIDALRQAPGSDRDGDGCPDKKELGDSQTAGGMRDPYNRWDFFNPEKVNTATTQTVADILKTVGQFGKNQGNVLYNIATDRTGIIGGNPWNLGPPDGQQTVADILASVKQFGHSCTP